MDTRERSRNRRTVKPNLQKTHTHTLIFHGFYLENMMASYRFLHGGADVEQHEENSSQQLQQGQGHLTSKDI